jgi:alpha-L-fucosidase
LLLNIGPKPDGTIPPDQVAILKDIGKWMKDNKEAIQGTDANPFGEFFDWGYCTVKGTDIYLHVTEWDEGKSIELPRLLSKVESVELLGDPGRKLTLTKGDGSPQILLSGKPVHGASVIKVHCAGDALEIGEVQIAEDQGKIQLPVKYAKNSGQRMSTLRHSIVKSQAVVKFAGGHPSERLIWDFQVTQPGKFRVVAECMMPGPEKINPHSAFLKFSEKKELEKKLSGTLRADGLIDFGTIQLEWVGSEQLALRVAGGRSGDPLYLRAIHLMRAE